MKKVKGFSYDTEKDKDVIEYIEKQPHQANYIWNLVRKDMCKTESEVEELVKKYIEKYLKDKKIDIKEESKISFDDVKNLLNLGNM